jgi:hypothetical protein
MPNRDTSIQTYVVNNPRKVGLFLLFAGAALLYQKLVQPIQAAEAGAPRVMLSSKLTIAGVIGVVFGLAYLLFGPRAARLLRPAAGESKTLTYLAVFVVAGIGTAIYLGVRHCLESKGYVFR